MFTSENTSYPSSNYHHSPVSFTIIPESNNMFLHQNLVHGSYNNFLPSLVNSPILKNPINGTMEPNLTNKFLLEAPITQENIMNFTPSNNTINNIPSTKRGASRKDRHTKISTSQGLRDRRVRLSINIAREFFSLQEMLGFDKASKTLGWLLAKSKAAIDELAASTSNKAQNTIEDFDQEKQVLREKSLKNKRVNYKVQNGEREMRREKARKRARERTKEKKMINDHNHNLNHHLENLICQHNQRAQKNLMMIGQSSSTAAPHGLISKGVISAGDYSVVGIKSKLNGASYHNYTYEMSSKDEQEGSNYYNDYDLRNMGMDLNGGIIHPPEFLAEVHINATPWDTFYN